MTGNGGVPKYQTTNINYNEKPTRVGALKDNPGFIPLTEAVMHYAGRKSNQDRPVDLKLEGANRWKYVTIERKKN